MKVWRLVFMLALISTMSIYLMFFVDIDEMMNPPLNAMCEGQTAEECYYMSGALCKQDNLHGLNCIRDGMTGGFFDTKVYYVCEGYGKVTRNCVDYYSYEEFNKFMEDSSPSQQEKSGENNGN